MLEVENCDGSKVYVLIYYKVNKKLKSLEKTQNFAKKKKNPTHYVCTMNTKKIEQ
jgi:hypothetical protein